MAIAGDLPKYESELVAVQDAEDEAEATVNKQGVCILCARGYFSGYWI